MQVGCFGVPPGEFVDMLANKNNICYAYIHTYIHTYMQVGCFGVPPGEFVDMLAGMRISMDMDISTYSRSLAGVYVCLYVCMYVCMYVLLL